jgi:hypothetical protein
MITGRLNRWCTWLVQIVLPALGTLYFVFSGPKANTVVGIIMILIWLFGAMLWMSQLVYAMKVGQGDLVIDEDKSGAMSMRLELDQTPEELANKREVRFKVKRQTVKQRTG